MHTTTQTIQALDEARVEAQALLIQRLPKSIQGTVTLLIPAIERMALPELLRVNQTRGQSAEDMLGRVLDSSTLQEHARIKESLAHHAQQIANEQAEQHEMLDAVMASAIRAATKIALTAAAA